MATTWTTSLLEAQEPGGPGRTYPLVVHDDGLWLRPFSFLTTQRIMNEINTTAQLLGTCLVPSQPASVPAELSVPLFSPAAVGLRVEQRVDRPYNAGWTGLHRMPGT
ncbi:MAG TPA: hypothetical protein VME20_01345 [Acidimicrobiales bacterium]|nr:hypothetical protein [Acidimicrobiales bacterium]